MARVSTSRLQPRRVVGAAVGLALLVGGTSVAAVVIKRASETFKTQGVVLSRDANELCIVEPDADPSGNRTRCFQVGPTHVGPSVPPGFPALVWIKDNRLVQIRSLSRAPSSYPPNMGTTER